MALVYSIPMHPDIPVLVIGYKRAKNLILIFDACRESGVKKLYFAVDAPANISDRLDVDETRNVIRSLGSESDLEIRYHFSTENAGCAAGVISACDWFFEHEDFGVIIEDDCIPSTDFFDFMCKALPLVKSERNIWLVSGTQFFGNKLRDAGWVLSKYPMHWGWGTTASAWRESRAQLDHHPPTFKKFLQSIRSPELIYWFAGERRAFYGFTDVWDSIYASNMVRLKRMAIVPSANLVTNIGDDLFATNTVGQQKFTQLPTEKYLSITNLPIRNFDYDREVRKRFFGISISHYVTTFYTLALDYFVPGRKIFPHLDSRLVDSKFND